jgi:hypothetical protein
MVKNFNIKKRKKAQMKIQQMSFMLLAVFLFFSLVGMIIVTVKLSDLRNSATELQRQNAMLLATKLASSPEFSCGEVYGTPRTDCIDLDKVMMLKENIDKYSNFWGSSNIEIRKIYPKNNGTSCTRSIYPECDVIKLIEKPISGYDMSNFVALCRKEVDKGEIVTKCEMGQIIIRYEEAK